MNYYISKIVIWFKNGTNRELNFLPNKVNVITGRSNTGKTAIIDIIDYCFFASKSKISESTINENVSWYGLEIKTNDDLITFARKAPKLSIVSEEYYFTNEVNNSLISPYANSDKKTIKTFFESAFGITSNARVKFGGRFFSPSSKVSVRYFQMFNTISGNIIENDSGVFFDKQSEDRYREALPRIFDLAVGIESIENIIKKDRIDYLESKLKKIERKNDRIDSQSDIFIEEKAELINLAKTYSLLPNDITGDEAWIKLSSLSIDSLADNSTDSKREKLENLQFSISNKIKKLKKFSNQYDSYKKSLNSLENRLKPIEYLREIDKDIIKTSIFDEITSQLSNQISVIKKERKSKTPLNIQVNDRLLDLENELQLVTEDLKQYPEINQNFSTSRERYFFLGEISTKAKLFSHSNKTNKTIDTSELEEQINSIHIEDTSIKKELSCRAIEEFITGYIETVGDSLENYKDYLPVFDYNSKSLGLRKPRTTYIENVGSSSNQMFLHLFFTLAMHDIIEQNKSSFVAPYMVIDQPSRPYYGDESEEEKKLSSSDQSKIKSAFKLLNKFISDKKKNNSNFQMIVLEHIPCELIESMENVNIVEVFRDGNALVRNENIS
ncbi:MULTISPECIES: DUF3732 domain-containing protein [Aliivibrio]|uniref:DUF3732 domain-containing protein n=1 Tax=Aliivibrio TaxID=511678 RepID=UPI00080DDF10|nr:MULTISPECIES: DUF3732 domain-containing protein [Aliivibrio]MBD1569108.1 DUF3732 domain-containing protein [Aliivibrio sp. S10_S31]OCH07874.1 hypothetical protein A6E11_13040 [Aliivibrio fischeri]